MSRRNPILETCIPPKLLNFRNSWKRFRDSEIPAPEFTLPKFRYSKSVFWKFQKNPRLQNPRFMIGSQNSQDVRIPKSNFKIPKFNDFRIGSQDCRIPRFPIFWINSCITILLYYCISNLSLDLRSWTLRSPVSPHICIHLCYRDLIFLQLFATKK